MSDQLDFPQIESASMAVAAPAPEGAIDFEKFDLTTIAIAQFGDWRGKVAAVTAKFTGIVLDLSTQARVDEAKSLRQREINAPLAEARKVAKALKSRLTAVSKDVGDEITSIEVAYANAGDLITPQIEAADAKLEAERLERARKEEERVAAHRARLDIFRNVIARAQGLPSERVAAAIAAVEGITVDSAEWEEFASQAETVKSETLTTLRDMHAKAVEAERIEAQRIENERIAAELAAKAAALAEQERAQAAEKLARDRAEAARQQRITSRLDDLVTKLGYTAEVASAQIDAAIMQLTSNEPNEDLFGERVAEAVTLHAEALDSLRAVKPMALAREEAERAAHFAEQVATFQASSEPVAAPAPVDVVPVAAPVAQIRQPDPAPAPAEEQPTLSTGEINDRLGFTMKSEFIASLGFTPSVGKGSARLFRESDFPKICSKLADHVLTVAAAKSLEKAA